MYCQNCGKELLEGADVCVGCGKVIGNQSKNVSATGKTKSKIVAGILAIFLGTYGVHNFYLKQFGIGITKVAIMVVVMVLMITTFIKGFGEIIECQEQSSGYEECEMSPETSLTIVGISFVTYIPAIWSFVEGILIFSGKINKDNEGTPLV